jgi:hypothetical protein
MDKCPLQRKNWSLFISQFCYTLKYLCTFYCDQPIVNETTRCVSDDFIKNFHDPGQNARRFYVWRKWRGRELNSGENVREIECAGEKDSIGERSGHSHSNRWKYDMIIRMFAVKRWTFPSDKLFITVFFKEGHLRSD